MKQTKTIVDMYTNKNQNSFIVFTMIKSSLSYVWLYMIFNKRLLIHDHSQN